MTTSRKEITGGLIAVALIALVIAWPFLTSQYLVGFGIFVLVWVAYTESWVVLSGMTGYFSFGHVVFAGLGGYLMAALWMVWPEEIAPYGVVIGGVRIWASMIVAAIASGLLALLVGYPCLRVRGPYFVILTFGVAEFVKFIVVNIEAGMSKSGRLMLGGPSTEALYFLMAALALVAFLLAFFVGRSRFGAGLRAIREDEDAAETMGIPVTRYKLTAFVLSAIIPGVVGALYVLRGGYFEPLQVFDPKISLTMICMAIMGGSDDARGPLFGVVFLAVLSELLWAKFPLIYQILIGIVLISFVLGAPDGIWGRIVQSSRKRAMNAAAKKPGSAS
ncbi:MAG: branched-chain amino acid ABC transporter permease [Alphaproteobacteria bacterium]|nr:branched-chain amino acid ABC transporter permease [Alphaproteobacteria bacterium]